jgi:hypothetical protein
VKSDFFLNDESNQQLTRNQTNHMKKSSYCSILCAAGLALALTTIARADDQSSASKPMTRATAVLVSKTATVQAIDLTNRELTLKGPLGDSVTFTVDPKVKRLNEVKVGDTVRADYYISLVAELRKPTREEEKTPFQLLDAAGKAPPGASPAVAGLRRFKVVTTVEGLDRPTQTVTVKGPRGNTLTARVADPENLTKMRIGDHIVVTYTEALAISLEKAEPKQAD